MTNFTQAFLAKARSTNDPVGDLISDMRSDADVPPLFKNIGAVRSYLLMKGASREAIAAVPVFWRRYRGWLDRNPTGK